MISNYIDKYTKLMLKLKDFHVVLRIRDRKVIRRNWTEKEETHNLFLFPIFVILGQRVVGDWIIGSQLSF